MQGTIIKGIGGFYYVKTDNEIIECKARGKFRHTELTPMVGDRVEIDVKDNKGFILNIEKRKNFLNRPPVANISLAFLIFTFINPELNSDLLNKMILNCELRDIKPVICFNKVELVDTDRYADIVDMLNKASCDVILLSAKKYIGIDSMKKMMKDNISVLCGPSGVGKSTLLNLLAEKDVMNTGDISVKLSRGKHTTRHCELVQCENGFIADTPGFSSLEIEPMDKQELQNYFYEFRQYAGCCKFNQCLHYKEPDCAVKNAVENGDINKLRYDFYIKTLEELKNRRKFR